MKKKVLSMILAATMGVSLLAGCGSSNDTKSDDSAKKDTTQEDSEKEGSESQSGAKTFTVGFDAEYPPYGYMDENGEYTGFDLELAQAVCDLEGWELVKKPISWDSKDMELDSEMCIRDSRWTVPCKVWCVLRKSAAWSGEYNPYQKTSADRPTRQ